jgi:hypothetical protein
VLTGVTTTGGSGLNAGLYAHTASGSDANYNLSFVDGALDIARRPLATWQGGSGRWSDATRWDALPQGDNVLAVSIPAGPSGQDEVVVTYDAGAAPVSLQSLDNAGNLTIDNAGLTAGRVTNAGVIRLATGQTLDLTSRTLDGEGTLRNDGLLTLSGNSTLNRLLNNGTLRAQGLNQIGALVNSGRFELQGGITTLTQDGYTQNAGDTLLGLAGAATTPAATLALPAGAQADFQGGVLAGSGRIDGSLRVGAAQVAPGFSPGSLQVSGDLTLSPASTLVMDLGGTAPSLSDRIVVGGQATLNGTLALRSVNGFQPATADRFTVMEAGTVQGRFAIIQPQGNDLATLSASQLQISAGGVLTGLSPAPADPAPQVETAIVTLEPVIDTAAIDQSTLVAPAYRDPADAGAPSDPPVIPSSTPAAAEDSTAPASDPTPPEPGAPTSPPAAEDDRKDEDQKDESPAAADAPAAATDKKEEDRSNAPPIDAQTATSAPPEPLSAAPVTRRGVVRTLELDPEPPPPPTSNPATPEVSYAPQKPKPEGPAC